MSEDNLRITGELAKLSLVPGDVLVLNVDEWMTAEMHHKIKTQMESVVPAGFKCMVLGRGMKLSVLTRSEIEARAA